jgi:hypothetical protein
VSDQPRYPSTSTIAGQQAATKSGGWRRRILDRLLVEPQTLWEVAAFYGVPDHVISGRFTELSKDLVIEHAGERRKHPVSGCEAEVWRIRRAANDPQPDVAELLGYPLELKIEGEIYDRQSLLAGGANEGYPAIPYARRADTGGVRLLVRVELIECPGCGKPLKMIVENGVKKFRCGVRTCNKTWSLQIVEAVGQAAGVAALVLKHG